MDNKGNILPSYMYHLKYYPFKLSHWKSLPADRRARLDIPELLREELDSHPSSEKSSHSTSTKRKASDLDSEETETPSKRTKSSDPLLLLAPDDSFSQMLNKEYQGEKFITSLT